MARLMNAMRATVMAAPLGFVAPAFAQDGAGGFLSGDWRLTIGAAGLTVPEYEGAGRNRLTIQPLVSVGRAGSERRFSSRNDNISIGIVDVGGIRAGATGKLIFGRDGGDSPDLVNLDPVRFGGEVGGFAEVYPLDWMRIRGEVRHGIRSHSGIVGDLSVDAFTDLTPTVRLSGGPRLSAASSRFFDAFYGVTPAESALTGLAVYTPGSGIRSAGFGGAITWKTTDRLTTSAFAEYSRLTGPAADSSLVQQRGSPNQFTFGLSATYSFDFSF